MHRMVTIDNATLTKAWENWLHFHRGVHCEEVETRFFNYVHPDYELSFVDDVLDWDGDEDIHYVLPDTAYRLTLAAGPHAETIFKAHYAKHPRK